jgi:fructose-1,6-bisphosphatase/inositol monophosphatase family enzyme
MKLSYRKGHILLEINYVDNIKEFLSTLGKKLVTFSPEKIEIVTEVNENLKTNIDQIAHDFIIEKLNLLSRLPVISEEDPISIRKQRPNMYWIIDPIDGTRSLVNGYQTYVCQVALIENSIPIMSVVYEPALNNFYHSIKGQGSYKNDQKLNSNLQKLPDSIIDNYPEPISSIKNLIKTTSISKYLECGSIALKMCRVADMSADLFLKKTRVFDWDIAPATLIVQEMGGVVSALSGKQILLGGSFKKNNLLVSANQSMHRYTLGKINELNELNDR